MENQVELDLRRTGRTKLLEDAPVRKRAVLLEDMTFEQAMGTEDRVPVTRMPTPQLKKAVVLDPVVEGPYSEWVSCMTPPPCSGDWDVRVIDEANHARCTFNARTNNWTVAGWPFPVAFGAGRLWRGLAFDPKAKKHD